LVAGKGGMKMLDPVTNVEVEDVLSSIRRLVSDDKRPSIASVATPSNDRLVLTPALRVAGSDEDVGETFPETKNQETQIWAWSDFVASSEQSDGDAEIGLDNTDNSPEGDDEDIAAQELYSETVGDSQCENDDNQSGHLQDGTFVETTPAIDPFVLEGASEIQTEDTTQEITDDTPDTDTPVAERIGEQGEAAFFASGAAVLSAKIAALETYIGKTDDQWEPDDTGDSDYSGTEAPAMTWNDADSEEISLDEAATSADTNTNPEAQAGFAQSVDDILDEEALRDLVSDIVREELQGALGERITRNVRKLVRREIHRALAAQELE
jgi:hypothetical protein